MMTTSAKPKEKRLNKFYATQGGLKAVVASAREGGESLREIVERFRVESGISISAATLSQYERRWAEENVETTAAA